jgi:dihydroxyacetone kinase-like predicted kinase
VQFLLEGEDLPVGEIKNKVIACGECPLVVGDEKLLKVHVHTMNPDDILNYARTKGIMKDIIVEDMDLQVQKKQ